MYVKIVRGDDEVIYDCVKAEYHLHGQENQILKDAVVGGPGVMSCAGSRIITHATIVLDVKGQEQRVVEEIDGGPGCAVYYMSEEGKTIDSKRF